MGRQAVINNKAAPHIPMPLTDDQLKKIFNQFDADKDHRLSREELKKAFEYLGSQFPSFRVWRGMHHADANSDGFISEEELDKLVKYVVPLGYTVKDTQLLRST